MKSEGDDLWYERAAEKMPIHLPGRATKGLVWGEKGGSFPVPKMLMMSSGSSRRMILSPGGCFLVPPLGMVPSPAAGVQGLNGSQVPLTLGASRPGMLEELVEVPSAFIIIHRDDPECILSLLTRL